MKVTINYITGRVRILTGVAGITTKQNASGTLVLEIAKTSGLTSTILVSLISSVSIECSSPYQRIQEVFLQ